MEQVSDGHLSDGRRYGAAKVKIFANSKYGAIGSAFLDDAITNDLKHLARGKRVLDIGCGAENWCHTAAQYGAKTVDGFGIQEEMVELAKQATSHLDMVHIKVGDAADMSYDITSFDVAISFFVTYQRHLLNASKSSIVSWHLVEKPPRLYQQIGLTVDYTQTLKLIQLATVENNTTQNLAEIPKYPTTAQVTEAFKDADDTLVTCFAVNIKDNIFHVKSIDQLTYG